MGALDRILGRFGYEKAHQTTGKRSLSRTATTNRLPADSTILRNWSALGSYRNVNRRVMIERSRDYVVNDGFLKNACAVLVNNIVGDGIRPNFVSRAEQPESVEGDRNKELLRIWNEDFGSNADVFGNLSFNGLQAAAFRSMFVSGECFIVRRMVDDGKPLATRLQICQTEQLDESINAPNTEYGIEYDDNGVPTAYWLFPRVLTGTNYYLNNNFESSRIPAEDVIHLYDNETGTMTRGMPWASAVLKTLFQIQSVQTSEAQRRMLEACFVAMVQTDGRHDIDAAIPERKEGDGLLTDLDGEDIRDLKPGTIGYLPNGMTMNFNDPKSSGDFPAWVRAYQMFAAAGLGIPYVLVSGDFAAVNYSSYRGANIEFQKQIRSVQRNIMLPRLCERVYRWVSEELAVRGLISEDDPRPEWIVPHVDFLDPMKENQASVIALENGLTTLEQEQTARGLNPEVQFDRIVAEREKYRQAGVKLPFMGGNGGGMNPAMMAQMAQMMGQNPPETPENQEDEAENQEEEQPNPEEESNDEA